MFSRGTIGGLLKPLIQELEQELEYTGAKSSGTGFEGLMQGMHEHADRTGIEYAEGSDAYSAFEFGVHFAHVSKSNLCRLSITDVCLALLPTTSPQRSYLYGNLRMAHRSDR